jgi:hypothetical protein
VARERPSGFYRQRRLVWRREKKEQGPERATHGARSRLARTTEGARAGTTAAGGRHDARVAHMWEQLWLRGGSDKGHWSWAGPGEKREMDPL